MNYRRYRRHPETGQEEYRCDLCHAWRPRMFMLPNGRLLCVSCYTTHRPHAIGERARQQVQIATALRQERDDVFERIRQRRAQVLR